jgi:glycosyltransferase involved in cell wall biosynthesis
VTTTSGERFVSVVTPFHNSALYLRECIESVLAQTGVDFEYILVDNKSTDDSLEIARRFAVQDSRIKLFENSEFLSQVANYNGALERISASSKFVKIIQADDALLPDCLRLMVEAAEQDSSIGLVSSFYLKGDQPAGSGISFGTRRLPGRAVLRTMLLTKAFPLGSPSSVMYRADIVRRRKPFYALARYHEDTEAAYEILLEHDFGFVHQILTFLRTGNESITSKVRAFNPGHLDYLILIEQYGRQVLSEAEFEPLRRREWNSYLGFLGRSLLLRRGPKFWKYHREGLATIGHTLRVRELLPYALSGAADWLLNPLDTIKRARGGAGRSQG